MRRLVPRAPSFPDFGSLSLVPLPQPCWQCFGVGVPLGAMHHGLVAAASLNARSAPAGPKTRSECGPRIPEEWDCGGVNVIQGSKQKWRNERNNSFGREAREECCGGGGVPGRGTERDPLVRARARERRRSKGSGPWRLVLGRWLYTPGLVPLLCFCRVVSKSLSRHFSLNSVPVHRRRKEHCRNSQVRACVCVYLR